jgi:hypothetical protein
MAALCYLSGRLLICRFFGKQAVQVGHCHEENESDQQWKQPLVKEVQDIAPERDVYAKLL